jgi:acetyl esterase/lipase
MRSRKGVKVMGRGRIGAAVLALAALIASSGAWGQSAGLPAECRAPLVRECRDSANRQACLRRVVQTLPDTCRKAVSDRQAALAPALGTGFREIAFGSDPRQRLDYALPPGAKGRAPVLLFVHGGGWSIGDKRHRVQPKATHFLAQGWAFASTNYRLVPDATVENQAADVAAAISLLRQQPGVDPDRIVLMGHSAGAHLVALVGSDGRYLQAAGVPLSAVRGVVALDGAGYDIARQMAEPRNRVEGAYRQAFGTEPKRQQALSPIAHAEAPNVGNWLILPVAHRGDSTTQSEALAAALRKGGAKAEVKPQQGKTHMTLNRDLGTVGDPATTVVDEFLRSLR